MNIKSSIKKGLEAMMYIWGEPLDVKLAAEVFNIDSKTAYAHFLELKREYDERNGGIRLVEINRAFQFVTNPDCAVYIERLCTPIKERKLSQAALEVLAIIAYKQPITKGEIDSIRGIKCDRVVEGLLKKELICEKGRSTAIGRPILYGTTDMFLKYMGFESIRDLPAIEDIENLTSDEYPADTGDEISAKQISIDDVMG